MARLRALAAALIAGLCLATVAAAQDRLNGTYQGVGDAEGARIEIAPDSEGFAGTFHDPRGRSQPFEADRDGASASAVLDMGGGPVLMQVSPMPYGAEVVFVPVTPDGRLDAARGRVDQFVRPGLSVPQPPAGFLPAPVTPNTRITGNAFVTSYEFWSPVGVRNGYLALPERARTMIRFFPAVQLDVIFKLCLAPGAASAQAEALRGQGVSCASVVDTMAGLQRAGRFDRYKASVAKELATLRTAMRCGEGHRMSRRDCDRASKAVADAALSLRTAQNVLATWR